MRCIAAAISLLAMQALGQSPGTCAVVAEDWPAENTTAVVGCPAGQWIARVTFASFGTPTGSCETGLAVNATCNAALSRNSTSALCLSARTCAVPVTVSMFGDPCEGTPKVLAVQVACEPIVPPAPAPANATTWLPTELTFLASGVYTNPFTQVQLTATFRGPSGQQLSVPGFWDGGMVWKVRFTPTVSGPWAWQTTSNDEGLTNHSGQLVAVDPSPGAVAANPNLAGFLQRSTDLRRFERAGSGAPFFWLGDTHWMGGDLEFWDSCNAPANASCGSSEFQFVVNDRVAKNFTVFQTYIHGILSHWWLQNWTMIDPTRFREVLDAELTYVNARGLVIAMGIGLHYMSEAMPQESLVALGGYVAARYSALNLIWITAQEVNAPNSNSTVWEAAARDGLHASDPYEHPLSAHMWVYESQSQQTEPFIWGDQPWHTWFATQGGHTGMGIRPQSHYASYWSYEPRQPFLEAEAMYEEIICGPRFAHANDTRIAAYKAMLCGSLGYTYGAAAIWLFKSSPTDPTGSQYNPDPMWWFEGMSLPGGVEMGFMRSFFEAIPCGWSSLTPTFSDPTWSRFNDPEMTVLAAVADATCLALFDYRGAASSPGQVNVSLAITAKSFNAQWFDPRAGQYLAPITLPVDATGWITLPAKPDSLDWAMHLVANSADDISA